MRSRLIITVIVVIGALLIARGCSERKDDTASKVGTANNAAQAQPVEFSLSAKDDQGVDLPEREEIRRTHRLTPGTKVFVIGLNDARVDTDGKQVFVMGINGGVKVETADTDTAEILIVRSARQREDLQHRKVNISNDGDLFIHIEDDSTPSPRRSVLSKIRRETLSHIKGDATLNPASETRERVVLRLPRKAGLEIHVVYGAVTVGETDGRLEIRNVDGRIRVARAAGPIDISNVNGGIDVTLAPLAGNGINIGGNVNGDVDLRFEGQVNADLKMWSVNGDIKPDFPDLDVPNREPERGRFRARLGAGGSVIEVRGVNGNVRLTKAGKIDAPGGETRP